MDGGGAARITRTPEDVFRDFRGRRAGMIKRSIFCKTKIFQLQKINPLLVCASRLMWAPLLPAASPVKTLVGVQQALARSTISMTSDAAAAASGGTEQASIQVVVIGDAGTGKSTLIEAIATESFVAEIPHLLPPVHLPSNSYRYSVPITVVDTSSRPEHKENLIAECKAADIIILTYACDCRSTSTLERLCTFWIPELRRLEVKVPMLVVGCKLDLRDDQQHVPLDQVMEPIMHQFREIQTCIECSALRQIQVPSSIRFEREDCGLSRCHFSDNSPDLDVKIMADTR
ncbi:mitochondrial Rho GTPase 1-like [Curcuma longa]|uniref:mitochondrial Rho GTPase 1-like n=1 Tax=Curcuma longa TaxID=136217 RepID=UPI003D9F154E